MKPFFLLLPLFLSLATSSQAPAEISGELRKWHKVTLSFEGPEVAETQLYNPFLHYRLEVVFRHERKTYRVPGYFAADGRAAETSADSGDRWRVHFSPDETGEWTYEVSFRKGPLVAIAESPRAGESGGYMDGLRGRFTILPSDKTDRDFRAKGRLQYVGKPYLQFAETGEYFLKAGADAPENLLAYADFDGNFQLDGQQDSLVKTWEPHVKDWKPGDPSWQNGKGKGLIGALNYLAGKGMNAFSFLPMNIAGDDRNVFPYLSYDCYDRMDVSKLDQWEIVFEHADQLGLFLHFKTSEAENQGLLDQGELGPQRKLYYRELIARFGHHLALNWNIGEENGLWMDDHPTPWQTTTQRLACARYFYENDPYRHHVVIHNGQEFHDLLGPESRYTGLSLQTHRADFTDIHGFVLKWKKLSQEARKNWAIALDEPGDHRFALVPDQVDPEHHSARQEALWAALMAGAWGIEWYFGYEHVHSDLTCQDWRSRDRMWDQSRFALDFFTQNQIPFWDLSPMDEATSNPQDYVLGRKGELYVIYQKMGAKTETLIPELTGSFELSWYNPRTGRFAGKKETRQAKDGLSTGLPPADREMDWVVLVRKI